MSDRRRYEVRRQLFGHGSQRSVGHDGNLSDALVVLANEAKVSRHRTETVPPGKGGHLDEDAGEIAVGFDVGVDRGRKLSEIRRGEGGPGAQVEDGVRRVEPVFDHVKLLRIGRLPHRSQETPPSPIPPASAPAIVIGTMQTRIGARGRALLKPESTAPRTSEPMIPAASP